MYENEIETRDGEIRELKNDLNRYIYTSKEQETAIYNLNQDVQNCRRINLYFEEENSLLLEENMFLTESLKKSESKVNKLESEAEANTTNLDLLAEVCSREKYKESSKTVSGKPTHRYNLRSRP